MLRSMRKQQNGFTLIEVLIAVAVLAIALMAVIRVIDVAVGNSQHLQQKTVAHWVAMNVLANARVGITLTPTAGATQRGQTKMLGNTYSWQLFAMNVPNLPIEKIQVKVLTSNNKTSLESLQMFVRKLGVIYAFK